jgi:hypothetical protein
MTIKLLQNRIDQIGLAVDGVGFAIETEDPLWCLTWQKARALYAENYENKRRYQDAIRTVKGYGWPIQKLHRDLEWRDLPQPEPLDFNAWTYRVKP